MRRKRIISLKLRRRVTKNLRVFLLYCRSWKKSVPKVIKSISIFSRKTWTKRFAISALIVTIIASSFTFFNHPTAVLGQTYSLTQSDWSGGTTVTTANGPANLSGYNQYASASGVTAGAGGVALAPSQLSFTETFANTAYKDTAATTADWSTSGQLAKAALAEYSVTNLSSKMTDAGMVSPVMSGGYYKDTANNFLYFGGYKSTGVFLARYSSQTNTVTDLTTSSGLNAIPLHDFNSINRMIMEGNKLYFTDGYGAFMVFDPTTGLTTKLTNVSSATSLAVDSINHKIYIGGGSGYFVVYTPGSPGSVVNLSSTISSFWGTDVVNRIVFDPFDKKIYLAGGAGKFAVYDPASEISTNLSISSGFSALWGTGSIDEMIFCPLDNKIYFSGDGRFASYITGTNTATDIYSSSGFTGSLRFYGMSFDSIGNKIYINTVSTYYSYRPDVAGSVVNLSSAVTEVGNLIGYDHALNSYMDLQDGRLYFGSDRGAFAAININQTTTTASNLSLALTAIWGDNFSIASSLYSPIDNKIYVSAYNWLLAKYDPVLGTAINITDETGGKTVRSMTLDVAGGKIYLGGPGYFAVYTPGSPGVATDLTVTSGLSSFWNGDEVTRMSVDETDHKIYLGSNTGQFAVYTPGSPGVATNLSISSGLSTFWTRNTTVFNGMAWDTNNHKLYLGGWNYTNNDGKFAVYTPGSPGVATDLSVSSGFSSIWYGGVDALVFDSTSLKLYLVGSYGNFAVYTPGWPGTATSLRSSANIEGVMGGQEITRMTFDSVNRKLYLAGRDGKLVVYAPDTGGTVHDLTASSGLSAFFGTNTVSELIPDFTYGRFYICNDGGRFGQINILPTPKATSLATDATTQKITSATLTKHDTPGTGAVTYFLSNDGGTTYVTVTPGSLFTFATGGSDLRFKILLDGNATVQDIAIDYNYLPASGELVSSKFDAVDPTNIVNQISWNEGSSLPAGTDVVVSMRTAATADGLGSAPWINFKNGQPASEPVTVAESFASTTNRDAANTTAAWDGSGQLSAGTVSSHDLSTALTNAGIGSDTTQIFADNANHLVYFGNYSGDFGVYDVRSGAVTNLTTSSGLSVFWGTSPIQSMAMDQGKVYLLSGNRRLAVYDPGTGLASSLAADQLWWDLGIMVADTQNHVLYMSGMYGYMLTYDIASQTLTNIATSSGLSSFWGSGSYEGIYGMVYDPDNGKVYIGGKNGDFASINTSDKQAVSLGGTSGFSSFWGTREVSGMAYSPMDRRIYFAGGEGGSFFASYAPSTNTANNIYASSGMQALAPVGQMASIGANTSGSQIYILDSGGRIIVYDIAANGSTVLATANNSYRMAVDGADSMIFTNAGANRYLGYITAPCSSCTATSTTIDATSQNILSATLVKNDTPGAGTITYQLSNDGGAHWETVAPGIPHVFSTTGSDLRFNVAFPGAATVQDVSIEYYAALAGSSPCSKTAGTVTCGFNTVPSSFQDGAADRFFQYKITLLSDGAATPNITSTAVQFVVNAAPEVRNVTAVQNANGTVTIGYETRDVDTAGGSPGNIDHITPHFEYWDGAAYHVISTLAPGDTGPVSVPHDGSWDNVVHTATWTPATDYPGHFMNGTAKIRVTANDGEGANPTGSAESSTFSLDTKTPVQSASGPVAVESGPWGAARDGATTNSAAINTAVASYILVGVTANRTSGATDEAVVSVSGGGLTFSKLAGGAIPADPATTSEFWGAYSSGPLTDATITATLNNPANFAFSILSLSGVKQGSPIGTVVGPLQANGNLVANFSSTSAGSMLFATAFSSPYAGAVTAGAGTTVYANQNGATQHLRSSTAVTGGAQSISSTGWGSSNADFVGLEILASQGSFIVDASGVSPVLKLSFADDSPLAMKISSTDPTLAAASSETFASTKTMPSLAEGNTVYGKIIDAFNNGTAVLSAPIPMTPASVIIQDISNVVATPNTFRLFLAWKATSGAFASYRIHRSTSAASPETWPEVAAIPSQATNFYVDNDVNQGDSLYYYVTAMDGAGNVSFRSSVVHATANGTQDAGEGGGGTAAAPTISNVSSGTPRSTQATVTWDTDTLASSLVEYSTTPSTFTRSAAVDSLVDNAAGVGGHQVILSGLAPMTQYYFRVSSTDMNGHASVADNGGVGYAFTTQAGPAISGTAVSGIKNTSAHIAWTTDIAASTEVVYSTHANLSAPTSVVSSDPSGTAHAIDITGLVPNTKYYYYVRSVDGSSNETIDNNIADGVVRYYEFTTTNDLTPPVISGVNVSLVSDTSAVIAWSTDEPSTSQAAYGATTAYGSQSATNPVLTITHSVTLTGLTAQTAYRYEVISADDNGNVATNDNAGSGYAFQTAAAPGAPPASARRPEVDTTPPVISGLQVGSIGKHAAIIEWGTDEAANGIIKFGPTIAYGTLAGSIDEKVSTHNVNLTDLKSGTIYHYIAVSSDAAGNQASSTDRMFATLNEDGSIVPVPVQPQDGQPVVPPTNTNTNANTPAPETPVVPEVKKPTIKDIFQTILDNPDLSSVPEDYLTTTVNEIIDRVVRAPSIVGPLPKVEVTGTGVKVSWTTDKKSNGAVWLVKDADYAPKAAEPYVISAVDANDNTTVHSVTIGDLVPATTYHFQVRSKGIVGSEARSIDATFVTASELPQITDLAIAKVSDLSAILSWKTNTPTRTDIEYKNLATGVALTQGDPAILRDHKFILDKLISGAPYTVVITATDENGGKTQSKPINLSTSKDTTAPVISGIKSDSTLYPGKDSRVQTIISWTTDEPSTSHVYYQEGLADNEPQLETQVDSALTTAHIVVITKFRSATVYKIKVESADAAGNVAKSDSVTVLTPQQKATILDVIIKNFEQVFGWTNKLGK